MRSRVAHQWRSGPHLQNGRSSSAWAQYAFGRRQWGSDRRPSASNRVWMAPAGQELCSGPAVGRSRPCIRRLCCGIRAAARPDDPKGRAKQRIPPALGSRSMARTPGSSGSNWVIVDRSPERATKRSGGAFRGRRGPDCRVAVRLPSPHVVPEARLRRDAPHRLVAGRKRPACPVRPGWPGNFHRFGVSHRVAMRSRPMANARTTRAMRFARGRQWNANGPSDIGGATTFTGFLSSMR